MTVLTAESPRERQLAGKLRAMAVAEIRSRGVDEAAQLLGVASSGVEALLWRQQWPLTLAFRVIEAVKGDLVEQWEQDLAARSNGSHASGS